MLTDTHIHAHTHTHTNIHAHIHTHIHTHTCTQMVWCFISVDCYHFVRLGGYDRW